MYDSSLPHSHLTKSVNEYTGSTHYEFNNAPVITSGFDGGYYNDDNGIGLSFNWDLQLNYYFSLGKVRVGNLQILNKLI